jgi:hypothetical protein
MENLYCLNKLDIDSDILFGHVRKSQTEFISTNSIKDICMTNKEIFAVSIILCIVQEPGSYDNFGVDKYIACAAYKLALLDSDFHSGDCICEAATCIKCVNEESFISGIEFIKELAPNDESIDQITFAMCVASLAEEYWIAFYEKELHTIYDDDNIPSSQNLIDKFLQLKDDEKSTLIARMKNVRDYIENPYPVNEIPWW